MCCKGLAVAILVVAGIAPVCSGAETGKAERKVVGWRTDTTGCYSNTTPPLRWGPDKNIAWSTPMPSWSDATPVIVGEKIVVTAEPDLLICLGKTDGKILWQRTNDVSRMCDLKSIRKERLARGADYRKRMDVLKEERAKIAAKLKKVWAVDVTAAVSGEDGELGAKESEEKDDSRKREAEAKVLRDKDAGLEAQIAEIEKICAGLDQVEAKRPLPEVGYACATPVSDGEVVFAFYGSGLGVLYDLDGNLKWSQFLHPVVMGYGQSMSPALAGDVLGVHVDEEFFGVDLKTGKILWQARETQHQGSPVAVKAGDTYVFLGTDGSVFRASDGRLITKAGYPSLDRFGTPTVRGNTASWLGEDKHLAVCVFEPKGKGDVAVKFSAKGIQGGVYYASGLIFDDKLVLWNNVDYKLDKKKLYVVDVNSGKKLAETNLTVRGWAYSTPAFAGGFVYVSGDKGDTAVFPAQHKRADGGSTAGPFELREVARNSLEPFRSCPVFEKDRMYIRGMGSMWCVQTSEDDRKLAAEILGK